MCQRLCLLLALCLACLPTLWAGTSAEADSTIYMPHELDSLPRTALTSGELLAYIATLEALSPRVSTPRDYQRERYGTVVVRFVVERDGRLSTPELYRSLDPALDSEALALLPHLPCWKPAERRGRPVRAYYYLPITYPPLPNYADKTIPQPRAPRLGDAHRLPER